MNKCTYRCLWFVRKVVRKLSNKKIVLNKYGEKRLITDSASSRLIREKIESGEPFMVARMGSVELNALVRNEKHILRGKKSKQAFKRLNSNAGFFPENGELLPKWCKLMFDSCRCVDLLGVWSNEMEDYLVEKYCKDSKICRLAALEPWVIDEPWSAALKNKKVLVIHPFEKTILEQYKKNRAEIFKGTEILPEFKNLFTVKAVQTIAGEVDERFADWFEALEWMYQEAMKCDFDIAIIGCGAYGFPLAAMLKKAGKQAIHLGGATQLFFGIKGKRWDSMEHINKWYNSYWVRPSEEEQPQRRKQIEGGCYW